MVVCHDVAVGGDDKARAGYGGRAGLSEHIRVGDLGLDADGLRTGKRVNVVCGACRAVYRGAGGADYRSVGGSVIAVVLTVHKTSGCGSGDPAEQRTHKAQTGDLQSEPTLGGLCPVVLLLLGLFLRGNIVVGKLRAFGLRNVLCVLIKSCFGSHETVLAVA